MQRKVNANGERMGYTVVPRYNTAEINKAGRMLNSTTPMAPEDQEWMYNVIDNWRISHWTPLVNFRIKLEGKAKKIDPTCLISQRIKRLSSIKFKLGRFPTMTLFQMQDLGGCRAVMKDIKDVYKLYSAYKNSKTQSTLLRERNYIEYPKPSGYRSVHLIYQYKSDKKTEYNGQIIEIQLRTRLQHIWATSVETVDTILKQSLKASRGSAEWQRFFILMGSVFALKENCSIVPGTPATKSELINELRELSVRLRVRERLLMYSTIAEHANRGGIAKNAYYLLELHPEKHVISISGFHRKALEKATNKYLEVEKKLKSSEEAVLVSVEKFTQLRHAYPNYFLDTKEFIIKLDDIIKNGLA